MDVPAVTVPPVTEATMRRAYGIAGGFYVHGQDRDDLAQEALLGALQARQAFRETLGTPFGAFEHRVMRSRVMDAVNKAHAVGRGAGVREAPLTETLTGGPSTVRLVEGRDELRRIIAGLPQLTPLERRAVVGFALGFRQAELGPRKQVDNALQRARKKLAA